ncbi:MAG: Frizzy aggregation protein FrzB [Myxococcota bacterium]
MSQEAPTVDLLLFEVGGTVMGADASQVLRIDAVAPDKKRAAGARALVFQAEDGERFVAVDEVREVKTVNVTDLRRMPEATGAPPYAIGVWLDGARPVPLVDLVEFSKS